MEAAYINSIGFISPQNTFENDFSCSIVYENEPILRCIEPTYKDYINPIQLRRMSRILKLGLGASQICLNNIQGTTPDAIVVGTGLACINDLEIFLKSITEENEQSLSPIPFINSSHNTVAAQIARGLKMQSYNITHCHRGVAFENALLDSLMLLNEKEATNVLLGGIDEFSENYYTLLGYDHMWEKDSHQQGAIAGEGAGFFMLSQKPSPTSFARICAAKTYYLPKEHIIPQFLQENNLTCNDIDAVMLGFNGNKSQDAIYFEQLGNYFLEDTCLLAYKHLCGEYTTSNAFALALCSHALRYGNFPQNCIYREGSKKDIKKVLLYNHYRGQNHSLILLEKI